MMMQHLLETLAAIKAPILGIVGATGAVTAGVADLLPGGPWTEIGAIGILGFCAWQLAGKIAPKWQADQAELQRLWMDHMVQVHREQVGAMQSSAVQYHEELRDLTRVHREQTAALRDLLNEIKARPCQLPNGVKLPEAG